VSLNVVPVCGAAPLSVTADAFSTDPTGITGYQFDFGDGTVLTRSPANRVAQHTYAGPGTYTITLSATNTAGGTGSASQPVSVVAAQPLTLPVSVGYADNSLVHQAGVPGSFPSPWVGSPSVAYVGTSSDIDAGAIKIDNPTGAAVPCISVRVQIGGVTFDLWKNHTAPAHGSLILTETAHQNFDTSDTSDQGPCGAPSASQPVVTVWSPGGVATHTDTGQVLNTGGVDIGHCPPDGTQARNESHPWVALP
jgi:PKD repeat protein